MEKKVQKPYWQTKDLEKKLGLFKNKRLKKLKATSSMKESFTYFHSKMELIRKEIEKKQ